MTPEQLTQFNDMKATLDSLVRVENVPFIENIKRRIDVAGDVSLAIGQTNLADLADVDTDGVTNGQVIKLNSSNDTWENANDNTS